MLFFRDRPANPPSKAASMIGHQKRKDYRLLLKKLFRNK
jgi:hypothetical protein